MYSLQFLTKHLRLSKRMCIDSPAIYLKKTRKYKTLKIM